MAALPENDRIAGPFLATAGQVDFPADFPLIKAEGLRVRRERAGVSVVLRTPDVSAVNLTEGGFTCRLSAPSQVGDRLFVYSELPAARWRAHAMNGAVRTATLEGDAEEYQAQLQEHRRQLAGAIRAPLGEEGGELPSAQKRANTLMMFDASGALIAQPVPIAWTQIGGAFEDFGPWSEDGGQLTRDYGAHG